MKPLKIRTRSTSKRCGLGIKRGKIRIRFLDLRLEPLKIHPTNQESFFLNCEQVNQLLANPPKKTDAENKYVIKSKFSTPELKNTNY